MDTTHKEVTSLLTGTSFKADANDYQSFHLRGEKMIKIRKLQWNIGLTVMTLVSSLLTNITLPLYSDSMTRDGHSDYPVLLLSVIWSPVLFFGIVLLLKFIDPLLSLRSTVGHGVMALVGFLNSTSILLIVFASNTSRTPVTIQAILSTSIIPFTVICRYVMLHKGVSRARLTCTGIVLIGLFISLEPVIFKIDWSNGGDLRDETSGYDKVMWPLIYMFGFIPKSIKIVILERELQKDQTTSFLFLAWSQLYTTIFIAMFLWTDFIPHFGSSDSFEEFADNLLYGLTCQYGMDPTCQGAVWASWFYIASFYSAILFRFFLVEYTDGAVYLVIVQALVTPIGALFWTFFSPVPELHWFPHFLQLSTFFVMLGIVIMVPAVAMYYYFGTQEGVGDRRSSGQRKR